MQGHYREVFHDYQLFEEWYEALYQAKQYRQIIDYVLHERSRTWLIAALIDGSDGYHTYQHAERLIDMYLDGETNGFCERCSACYHNDLLYMMACDIYHMFYVESHDMGTVQRLLVLTDHLGTKKDSYMYSTAVSMLYPTMAV